MIHAHEGGVLDHRDALLAAVIRMRPPADIRQQAARVAQAALVGGLVTVQGRDEPIRPGDQLLAVARRARAQDVEFRRRGQQRIDQPCVPVELLEQQALADARCRDRHLARAPDPDDLLQHDGSVGEQRAPRLRDRVDVLQQRHVGLLDDLQEAELVGGLHRVAVHHVDGVAAGRLVEPRDRPPRAADRVEGPPAQGLELRGGLAHVLADDLGGLLDRAAGQVLQGETAEGHGHPLADDGPADVHEFEGAAAHVAHHAVRRVEARDHAERGQLRLPPSGEQLDLLTAGCLGGAEEVGTVLGVPRRRGGEHEDLPDAHRLAQHPESTQGGECAGHRLLVQPAGRQDIAAQAAEHFLVVERRRRPGQSVIRDEADRVGADIDDRHRMVRGAVDRLRVPREGEIGKRAAQTSESFISPAYLPARRAGGLTQRRRAAKLSCVARVG